MSDPRGWEALTQQEAEQDTEERVDSHGENPLYGPGNPDWERDFEKTRGDV